MKAKVPKIASKSIQIELIPFTFLAADAIASLSLSLYSPRCISFRFLYSPFDVVYTWRSIVGQKLRRV